MKSGKQKIPVHSIQISRDMVLPFTELFLQSSVGCTARSNVYSDPNPGPNFGKRAFLFKILSFTRDVWK